MFVLIKEVVFVEWFRIRKIPVRIPRNFKLNSEKSSTNCSALLCPVDILNNFCFDTYAEKSFCLSVFLYFYLSVSLSVGLSFYLSDILLTF